jgi:hypothetical protein
MQIDQYLLCVKSGKKWVAVAGLNLGPDSCVARASHVFADAGYETWGNKVCWGVSIEKQANYGGKSLNYKTLPTPATTLTF